MRSDSQNHEAADVETSSAGYAARFSGVTGDWLLSRQTEIVLDMVQQVRPQTILDVAGGHGQIARPLAKTGYQVTVSGSSKKCDEQIRDLLSTGTCSFHAGSLQEMPFESHSFDVVTCFRYLSHCPTWPRVIAEMCRIARHAVIVDYPPLCSFNFLNPFLFHIKRKLEGNTRTFRVFTDAEINQVFISHGFAPAQKVPQFFFPMVIHRVLKRPSFSDKLENTAKRLGFTHAFGSPTITLFARQN